MEKHEEKLGGATGLSKGWGKRSVKFPTYPIFLIARPFWGLPQRALRNGGSVGWQSLLYASTWSDWDTSGSLDWDLGVNQPVTSIY